MSFDHLTDDDMVFFEDMDTIDYDYYEEIEDMYDDQVDLVDKEY